MNQRRPSPLVSSLLWVCAIGAPASAAAVESVAAPSTETFDVLEYRVLGNSRLSVAEIEAAVYPHLGPGRSIDTVQEARASLERAYRDRGFGTVFVDVPEQDVDEGVVRLRVTEGRLDRVQVSGTRYYSNRRILAALPAVERGGVPDLGALQQQIATFNRQSQDRSIAPILRAGRTPGTFDLAVKVEDKLPLHGSLDVNNRYTADTTELRAAATLSYDNLFQRNHRLSLQYQTAPERREDANVIAATYIAPLGESGRLLAVYAVDTDSDLTTVGNLSVLGKGRIYGARLILPLPERVGLFHSLSLGADFKDFDETITFTNDDGLKTPIQYVGWSLAWSGNRVTEHSRTGIALSANFGVRGLANAPGEFFDKRLLADPNYFYVRAELTQERPFLLGTSLAGRFTGQMTAAPLVSNEQLSIGGADTVRGYLESEELGDYGFSASLELRSPNFGLRLSERLPRAYLFAFFDAGNVAVHDPLEGQGRRDLSSVGAGLRFSALEGLEGALDWAYPLVPASRTLDGDSRLHFQLTYGF